MNDSLSHTTSSTQAPSTTTMHWCQTEDDASAILDKLLAQIRHTDAKLNVVCDQLERMEDVMKALRVRVRRAEECPLSGFGYNLKLRLQTVQSVHAVIYEFGLRLADDLNYLQAHAALSP